MDWCQIGEKEVVPQERLAVLLPVIKHMTPIGLTTPSQFSVSLLFYNLLYLSIFVGALSIRSSVRPFSEPFYWFIGFYRLIILEVEFGDVGTYIFSVVDFLIIKH